MAKKLSAYNLHVRKERKAGKTMKQAATSWKAKKKGGKAKSSPRKGGKKTVAKKKTSSSNKAKKILGNYGVVGLLEDAAIGFFGTSLIMSRGYPMESAMPLTRVIQGAAGKVLNRRGKGRLAYGLIDLIDVYLLKKGISVTQGITQGISLEAWK